MATSFETDLQLKTLHLDTQSSELVLPDVSSNCNDNGILHGGAIIALAIKSSEQIISLIRGEDSSFRFELSNINCNFYHMTKGQDIQSRAVLKRRSKSFLFISCSIESSSSNPLIASFDLIFSAQRDSLKTLAQGWGLYAPPASSHIFKEKFLLKQLSPLHTSASRFSLEPNSYFIAKEGAFDASALVALADTCIMKHFWDPLPQAEKHEYFGCTVSLALQVISSVDASLVFETTVIELRNNNYAVDLKILNPSGGDVARCQSLYRFYKSSQL